MIGLHNYITEKLHLKKGDHLKGDTTIDFPARIKFWWSRKYVYSVRDDLRDLSEIQMFGVTDCNKRQNDDCRFYLYEIKVDSYSDLYAFMGCVCWMSIPVTDHLTKDSLNYLHTCITEYNGFIKPDDIDENLIDKLDIDKLDDAFQYALKKFPR